MSSLQATKISGGDKVECCVHKVAVLPTFITDGVDFVYICDECAQQVIAGTSFKALTGHPYNWDDTTVRDFLTMLYK